MANPPTPLAFAPKRATLKLSRPPTQFLALQARTQRMKLADVAVVQLLAVEGVARFPPGTGNSRAPLHGSIRSFYKIRSAKPPTIQSQRPRIWPNEVDCFPD